MIAQLRQWWQNKVVLPGPVDLGRSKTNALPSAEFLGGFPGFPEGTYTWEDWAKEVRGRYPIRWAIHQVLGELSIHYGYLERAGYWLKSHTTQRRHLLDLAEVLQDVPVRYLYRHRLLDLSQAEREMPEGYRYGYIDPCRIIFLASFLALRMFVEREQPRDPRECFTREELENEPGKSEKEQYDEIMALYCWWREGRRRDWEESNRLYMLTRQLSRQSPLYRQVSDAWRDHDHRMEVQEHEMLKRLIEVQPYLWT